MLLSNLEILPGKQVVKHLGLVQGSSVRSKHAGRDIMSGIPYRVEARTGQGPRG